MLNFEKIKDVKLLEEGDIIRILNKPDSWASYLNKNSPINKSPLKFPYVLKIQKIKWKGDYWAMTCGDYWAMTCGEYGWDLDSIIEAGCEWLESPKKWYWEVTDIDLCNKLIHKFCKDYKGYDEKEWLSGDIGSFFIYPQSVPGSHSNSLYPPPIDYEEITTNDIRILLNKKQVVTDPIVKEDLDYFYNKFKQQK